jgi:hypothetical protein
MGRRENLLGAQVIRADRECPLRHTVVADVGISDE